MAAIAPPMNCTIEIPADLYQAWLDDVFDLVTSEEQTRELRTSSRYPKALEFLKPHDVGFTSNRMREANLYVNVPRRHAALDPTDSFLLDLAAVSKADYLVTGDKSSGLLQRGKLGHTRISVPPNSAVAY